jgi:hypothetical protein
MQKNEDRLNQIENDLTPKQKYFAWLDKQGSVESDEELKLAIEHWDIDRNHQEPLDTLVREVVDSIKKRLKDSGPLTNKNPIRQAIRDIVFLDCLVVLMRREFERLSDLVRIQLAKLNAIAELLPDPPNAESKSTICREKFEILGAPCFFAMIGFMLMAHELEAVVDDVQAKYFEGHSILRRDQAKTLDQYTLESKIYARKSREANSPEDLEKFWNLVPAYDLKPAQHNQPFVHLARFAALYVTGDFKNALDFRKKFLTAGRCETEGTVKGLTETVEPASRKHTGQRWKFWVE